MVHLKWITPLIKQCWCVSSVLIYNVAQGVGLAHTASLLPALLAPAAAGLRVDLAAASWLVSLPAMISVLGIVTASLSMKWLGRRAAYFLSIIPGIIGWVMIYMADSYELLLIGKSLAGITGVSTCIVGVIIIAEYTSPEYRGIFMNLKTTCVCIGISITHFLDQFIDWRGLAVVGLVPQVVALAIIPTWPESPSWLASKQRYDKCKKDFFWLRGVTERSVREVNDLIESQKERFLTPHVEMRVKVREFFYKFAMKDFLKPLFVNIVALILMETSGRHYFPSYALQIMRDVIDLKTPVHYYTLCIDIIITASTMVSALFIKIVKMRTLLFTSGIGGLVTLVFMCTFLFLTSKGIISNYPIVITFLFIVYFSFVNLGCTPVPLALQGELFPIAHRETGMLVFGVFISFGFMAVLKATPYMLLAFDVYGTLALYGLIMAICLVILYFTLPETKDKTLQEIENNFK